MTKFSLGTSLVLASVAATLIASPSFAAKHYVLAASSYSATGAYASANDPYAVVVDGKVVGRDPDAFIRGQLLRVGDPTESNGGN